LAASFSSASPIVLDETCELADTTHGVVPEFQYLFLHGVHWVSRIESGYADVHCVPVYKLTDPDTRRFQVAKAIHRSLRSKHFTSTVLEMPSLI
jgi:hypothetical protein